MWSLTFWQFLFALTPFLGCPKDWVANDTYCYKVNATYQPDSMEKAQEKCKEMSARLPIIKSKQENIFIASLMSKEIHRVWLGMKSRGNYKFFWFDGSSAENNNNKRYSAWATGEPKHPHQWCAYMSISKSVPEWYAATCSNYPAKPPFFICQKSRL